MLLDNLGQREIILECVMGFRQAVWVIVCNRKGELAI